MKYFRKKISEIENQAKKQTIFLLVSFNGLENFRVTVKANWNFKPSQRDYESENDFYFSSIFWTLD